MLVSEHERAFPVIPVHAAELSAMGAILSASESQVKELKEEVKELKGEVEELQKGGEPESGTDSLRLNCTSKNKVEELERENTGKVRQLYLM